MDGLGQPTLDLFFFWRRVLVIACTVYGLVRLAQTAVMWYSRLTAPGRTVAMTRQYMLLQLLRVSPRRFLWQIIDLLVLSALLLTLIYLHNLLRAG